MADDRKDLPAESAPNFNQRLRETLMTYLGKQGNKLDRGVTLRDLVDSGIAKLRDGYLNVGGGSGGSPIGGPGSSVGTAPDLTPPPTPTGFTAAAAISNLIIECDPPTYRQGHGHGASVLYGVTVAGGAPLPTFSDAVELTAAPGTVFTYATNPATVWRLWLKWRSRDGVLSVDPAGGINGLEVKTGVDVRAMLDALSDAALDPDAPYSMFAIRAGLFFVASDLDPTAQPLFYVVTAPITVGGVVVPAGVYMADGYIMNGTITNAKIANLAVDDAKIASLAVGKLIAGSIAVGEYIQSTDYIANVQGWRINGAGNAEFGSGSFRGNIVATGGAIGGSIIGADFIRSSTYAAGGFGWRFDSGGTGQIGGFTVGGDSIYSGNYLAGVSGWRIGNDGSTQFGDILLIGGTIRNASDSFRMDMNATGSTLLLRAGPLTYYGPYAGTHYPVEIRADGGAFFGRGVVAGGQLKASGGYLIPEAERPAVQFFTASPPSGGGGDGP